MKTSIKMLSKALAAVAMLFCLNANAQVSICNQRAEVLVDNLSVSGDKVVADYDISFIPNVVAYCCKEPGAIVVTPAIVNEKSGEKQVLEVIVVNGPNAQINKWLQDKCNACSDNVRVFTSVENRPLTVSSSYAVDYQPWMDEACLMITTQKMKYPECLTRLCQDKVAPVNNQLAPAWAELEPAPSADEPRKHVRTRLYFPVNVTKSVENYFENADALALLKTLDSPYFDVTNIQIDGWASPEATVPYNQKLSDNRAKTMKNIIAQNYNFDEGVYQMKGNGEYWDDVIEYVKNSDDAVVLASKDKLEKWLEETAGMDLDKKEAELKKIDGGKPYRAIFNAVYPRSRFTDCDITYVAKEDVNDLVNVLFEQDPSMLSEADFVALVKEDGKKLDVALAQYPNSAALNAIAAKKAVAAGDIDAALKHYEKAGNSAEAYNNQAACWMLKGNAKKAAECLEKAKGIAEYNVNIKELKKVK